MTKEGEFAEFEFEGVPYKGKALLDLADQITVKHILPAKKAKKRSTEILYGTYGAEKPLLCLAKPE